MKSIVKSVIKGLVRRTGYDLVRVAETGPSNANEFHSVDSLADLNPAEKEILRKVKGFTMTGEANVLNLIRAVTYLSKNSIPGALVECGVWRGGSMMAAALTLKALGDFSRELWLYDTYEGMTQPTNDDVRFDGQSAKTEMAAVLARTSEWCCATLADVTTNLHSTGYPNGKIHFIKGMVEETLPIFRPGAVSLLRLDTDWYESTRCELELLFPSLHPHGVLIVDDYGHWKGAQKAVDEYFGKSPVPVYLHRIDYTARILVAPGAH
jgi:hypothetical protein